MIVLLHFIPHINLTPLCKEASPMTTSPQEFGHILCGPDFEYCGVPEFLQTSSTNFPSLPVVPRRGYGIFPCIPFGIPAALVHLPLLVGVFCWPRSWVRVRNTHIFALVLGIPLGPLTPVVYVEWICAVTLAFAVYLRFQEEIREASRNKTPQ
jgi:hypothetical protein